MIAVIVLNYKSEDRTIEFVRKETTCINIPYRVVVVNNGATHESDNIMANALDAQIIQPGEHCDNNRICYIISNSINSGFAKGNNIGAKFAVECLDADYLLFSNNDIKFLDDFLVEKLINKLDSTPKAGIIGPRIVGLDGKLQSPEPFYPFWDRHVWMYLCTPFFSKQKKSIRFNFNYSETAQEGFHYKLMGSFFLTRSRDYLNCGMMDENTFLYGEEPILTERMKKIGLKPYYCPFVSVLHVHGATISSNYSSNRQKDLMLESECYYYRTYMNTPLYQIWIGKLVQKFVHLIK